MSHNLTVTLYHDFFIKSILHHNELHTLQIFELFKYLKWAIKAKTTA